MTAGASTLEGLWGKGWTAGGRLQVVGIQPAALRCPPWLWITQHAGFYNKLFAGSA